MKRILAAAAAALLIAVPAASFAADTPQTASLHQEAQGPDFSACDAEEGRERGQCVAEIARAYGDDHAEGADSAKKADDAVGQDEEHASAVTAAAQEKVDDCDAKEGREFGECVSAAAHELGELAGGQEAQGQGGAQRSDSAAAGRGQSGR
jgi:hypothetical protein